MYLGIYIYILEYMRKYDEEKNNALNSIFVHLL